ncbi:MAG: hypothetical protein GY731_12335, partial [Gammaproteobacteria bacterium]|nr:hypothetical protein [Gammaproteobacteria bacterium]
GTESKYLEAHDLKTLFRDTMRRPRGGNEPLVELFRTKFDLIGYIRFGRTDLPSEPEDEAEEVVAEARETEVKSAEPSVKGVKPEKREPQKKTVRQKPGQLDQLLLRSRESLSENRLDEAEKYAQEGRELAARSQEAEQTAAFLEVLAETTLQLGTPSALPRLMDDTYHLTESAFGAGQWPVAHAALERVKARFRDRLRAYLKDSKEMERIKEGEEGLRAALDGLEDRRPGVGCDGDPYLMAWVPIRRAEKIQLGDGMRGSPDPEFAQDNEKWDSTDTLTIDPFLLASYPVTVAQ